MLDFLFHLSRFRQQCLNHLLHLIAFGLPQNVVIQTQLHELHVGFAEVAASINCLLLEVIIQLLVVFHLGLVGLQRVHELHVILGHERLEQFANVSPLVLLQDMREDFPAEEERLGFVLKMNVFETLYFPFGRL